MQHTNIYTCNVSVVRVNGTILMVGGPTAFTLSSTAFGTKSHMFGPCKGHVVACSRTCGFAHIRSSTHAGQRTCRTTTFVAAMCSFYEPTVQCSQ